MIGTTGDPKVSFGINLVFCKHIKAGHQVTGSGVGVTIAKTQALAVFEHLFQRVVRAVGIYDQVRVVALGAVGIDHLGKNFTIGAVNRFHGGLVAQPGYLDLVEAHAFNDASVVRRKECSDIEAGLTLHVFDQRRPVLLQVLGGFGRDDAEVDVLSDGTGACQAQSKGCGRGGQQLFQHEKLL